VLRGDDEALEVGECSNVQDNAVLHADPGFPLLIGRGCTIGHGAVVHGCTIGDNSLVGMGATVMNGARVGANCVIGANALITEGKAFPDNSLIMGAPAKALRELDADAVAGLSRSAEAYGRKWRRYAAGAAPMSSSPCLVSERGEPCPARVACPRGGGFQVELSPSGPRPPARRLCRRRRVLAGDEPAVGVGQPGIGRLLVAGAARLELGGVYSMRLAVMSFLPTGVAFPTLG
jgi:carbonic anhydrase/acetyltransferase-like protein (isoleucine patch superfamily)